MRRPEKPARLPNSKTVDKAVLTARYLRPVHYNGASGCRAAQQTACDTCRSVGYPAVAENVRGTAKQNVTLIESSAACDAYLISRMLAARGDLYKDEDADACMKVFLKRFKEMVAIAAHERRIVERYFPADELAAPAEPVQPPYRRHNVTAAAIDGPFLGEAESPFGQLPWELLSDILMRACLGSHGHGSRSRMVVCQCAVSAAARVCRRWRRVTADDIRLLPVSLPVKTWPSDEVERNKSLLPPVKWASLEASTISPHAAARDTAACAVRRRPADETSGSRGLSYLFSRRRDEEASVYISHGGPLLSTCTTAMRRYVSCGEPITLRGCFPFISEASASRSRGGSMGQLMWIRVIDLFADTIPGLCGTAEDNDAAAVASANRVETFRRFVVDVLCAEAVAVKRCWDASSSKPVMVYAIRMHGKRMREALPESAVEETCIAVEKQACVLPYFVGSSGRDDDEEEEIRSFYSNVTKEAIKYTCFVAAAEAGIV